MDDQRRPPVPDGVDESVWMELPISICQQLVGEVGAPASPASPTFIDPEFPPSRVSLSGLETSPEFERQANKTEALSCHCKMQARLNTVRKDGKNQGKLFYGCRKRQCGFFMWAPENTIGPYVLRRSNFGKGMRWQRFSPSKGWTLVKPTIGFSSLDVKQGSVGDCWFLSALAVLAERPDLINQVALTQEPSDIGKYSFRLFIDGQWQVYDIDDHLPMKGDLPAFSQTSRDQLWVPLLEKAYAKAHGSYWSISGGEIAEAMLELTACPTETISFSSSTFDSNETWERLVSFSSSQFPMGCATATGGDGLVGMHAYSILEVKTLTGLLPGIQTKMHEYFPRKRIPSADTSQPRPQDNVEDHIADDGSLRVLRIRNPWGKREWKGAWGGNSEMWTPKLRKLLNKGDKNDGTFWMSYPDFLLRFTLVDVCKAHMNWKSTVVPNVGLGGCVVLRASENAWAYIMFVQKSSRGRSLRSAQISMALCRRREGKVASVTKTVHGGCVRDAHFEVMLEASSSYENSGEDYVIWPFSFDPKTPTGFSLSICILSSKAVEVERLDEDSTPTEHISGVLLRSLKSMQMLTTVYSEDKSARLEVFGEGSSKFFLVSNAKEEAQVVSLSVTAPFMRQYRPPQRKDSTGSPSGVLIPPRTSRLVFVLLINDSLMVVGEEVPDAAAIFAINSIRLRPFLEDGLEHEVECPPLMMPVPY
ncbi:hypothetical protein NDN08_007897 [Rhodosorus marinus]|uniref:Calpain catalytic domain-containing protein n=1 Tax=Rhodosorus marinus TaxID=101924 RepID=A0AAV8V2Z0_9RHOD|nr:hypothetical protein NDN08_007897 [Rhodosorus marinus]